MKDRLHFSCSSAFLRMRKRFLVGSVSIAEKNNAGCIDGLLASKLSCFTFSVTQKPCFNSPFKLLLYLESLSKLQYLFIILKPADVLNEL